MKPKATEIKHLLYYYFLCFDFVWLHKKNRFLTVAIFDSPRFDSDFSVVKGRQMIIVTCNREKMVPASDHSQLTP